MLPLPRLRREKTADFGVDGSRNDGFPAVELSMTSWRSLKRARHLVWSSALRRFPSEPRKHGTPIVPNCLLAVSTILVAVEGSAMLPSTNSSLSDALNPPVFVMLREVATTL